MYIKKILECNYYSLYLLIIYNKPKNNILGRWNKIDKYQLENRIKYANIDNCGITNNKYKYNI